MSRRDRSGMRACATTLAGVFVLAIAVLVGTAVGDAGSDPNGGTGHEGGPAVCVGDVIPDGNVNIADLMVVLASWGECPGCPGDTNGDGWVDVQDLLNVMEWWGPCAG